MAPALDEPVIEGKRHAGLVPSRDEIRCHLFKNDGLKRHVFALPSMYSGSGSVVGVGAGPGRRHFRADAGTRDNTMTASANVPARMSCTVEWLSSGRTTEGLPSGASVAGGGRGLEVPAEIRWVGMNSRMCRNAKRTFCGCCQFDPDVGWRGKAAWAARSLPPKQRHFWRALQSSPPVRGLDHI